MFYCGCDRWFDEAHQLFRHIVIEHENEPEDVKLRMEASMNWQLAHYVESPRVEDPLIASSSLETPDQNSEAAIPPFDPSVINGIYWKFVELVTRGTTLAPQYAFVIAK